ncbi:Pleckstrin (PH) and lipid-binding START domains-containing protein [Citrus sinensis]|uniref:Pleckstrin (PH) and lipid-binding START domains-containing protein n=1 Tax=Citrus sinensis TaxID=2711 RepID=A0ACB8ITY9_CITSI|nr:Pleckstrin (PH) and lipid-binding START domains-containing protein [Citrus sinensis]
MEEKVFTEKYENGDVFFIFTLYNTSNHNDQLKLGASSPEEAAKWIHSLQEAALKGGPHQGVGDHIGCPNSPWESFRLSGSSRASHTKSIDWTLCSGTHMEQVTADVIAPSPWTIFGCQNDQELNTFILSAVGRSSCNNGCGGGGWGCVVEHLDGHTDIIHKQLYSDWLPWGMKRRDLLLRRYWRREDDGTYVVKHMLAIDWKCWRSYLQPSSARSITIRMLGRVAALRELFRAKQGNYSSPEFLSGELTRNMRMHQTDGNMVQMPTEDGNSKENTSEEVDQVSSEHASLVGLNDAADEFFDVPEPSDYDDSENGWTSDFGPEMNSQDTRHPKISTAAGFVRKLHDLAAVCVTHLFRHLLTIDVKRLLCMTVQKRGYVDLQGTAKEDNFSCCYGTTLQKDPTCTLPCSWTSTDPSTFLIRGKNYLQDRHKVKAKGTLMQMVAADWLKSDKREDDLGGRPGGIVQVPGSTTYSLALYYMMTTPVKDAPLLESFINGDDAYRNSRFKLIPYISEGSWIVKQSVGKKACLIGQALEINYFHGKNYLELGVDIGSSTVARGVVSLVLGYLNNLVIEMAFLIQANTEEELPEFLLGTCRLNHLDAAKAVLLKPSSRLSSSSQGPVRN